jgi:phage shock protein A
MKFLAKLQPKSLLYWFLGDKAGTSLVAVWNWLWGIPIESGGKIAVEAARGSLEMMQRAIADLTDSVAKVEAAHKTALAKYGEKKNEHTELLQQVVIAHQKGHAELARLAMAKAIAVEKILPSMQERVNQVEEVLKAAKGKLRREQDKLEMYKLEMSNLKAMGSINEAMGSINDIDNDLNLNGTQERFDDAGEAIGNRYLIETARIELSENPNEKIRLELDELTLDEEISRRLAEFNPKN